MSDVTHVVRPYGGYLRHEVPPDDATVTRTNRGTPCGELMRRYWQPVAMSSELRDLPVAIRILGEDLVAFRDRSGRVGVLHKHCSHRGASLEFGRIAERGIRCCYHGWHFDVDGTVLDTPGEPPGSTLKSLVCHGAYPALERAGLVFAYLGPPDERPEFPELDSFTLPDTDLVPYSLHHDCNWLQVHENLMDPFHAVFLHARMGEVQLTPAWGEMPIVEWGEHRDRMYYVASRRLGQNVWVRFNEVGLPNFGQVAGFWEDGERVNLFQRIGATRWTVPLDDTHCRIFGLRHFSDELEAKGIGDRTKVGKDSLDIYGQTGDRPYEEMQRNPGDWEVEVSQRSIAIHALENRGTTDRGVVMLRRQIAKATADRPAPTRAVGGVVPTWTSNTIIAVPPRNAIDDRDLLKSVGRAVVAAVIAEDETAPEQRMARIRDRLAAIRGTTLAP